MVYRKIVCAIIKTGFGAAAVLSASFRFALAVSKNKDREKNKYRTYYRLMLSWMTALEDGQSLCGCLRKKGFRRIAVYGGRDMGMHLVRQLQGTEVTTAYVVDKNVYLNQDGMPPVYPPDGRLPAVDAVIVTPVWDYEHIKKQLAGRADCPVISLEDVLSEVDCG